MQNTFVTAQQVLGSLDSLFHVSECRQFWKQRKFILLITMAVTTATWTTVHQSNLCVHSVPIQDWQICKCVKVDITFCSNLPVSFWKITGNTEPIGEIQRKFKGTKISLTTRIFCLGNFSFYTLWSSSSDLTFMSWGHFVLNAVHLDCHVPACSTQFLWMCETHKVYIYVKPVGFELTSVKSTNLCLMLGKDPISRICWISSDLFLSFSSSSSKACWRSCSFSSQTFWTGR